MSEESGSGRYDRSLADLMAGVAVVFLILAAIFIIKATNMREEAERERDEAAQRKDELEKHYGGQEAQVSKTLKDLHAQLMVLNKDRAGFLRLKDLPDGDISALEIELADTHFESGRCFTPRTGRENLREAGPRLVEQICDAVVKISISGAKPTITMEGHADRTPFRVRSPECGVFDVGPGKEFENNVRASAARAQSIFFALREAVGSSEDELECLRKHFVVAGRGDSESSTERHADDASRRTLIRLRGDLVARVAEPSADNRGAE